MLRKMILATALLAASLLPFAAPARADVRVHKGAQVSIDVPSTWKVQTKGSDMVIVDSKEEVLVVLRVLEAHELKGAVDKAEAYIARTVQSPKWDDKATPTQLNGMDAIALEGTGAYKGRPVDMGAVIVKTPAQKALLVVGLMDHAAAAAHQGEVEAFLHSIKPAK